MNSKGNLRRRIGVIIAVLCGLLVIAIMSYAFYFEVNNRRVLDSMKKEVASMNIKAPLVYSECNLSDGFESENFCIFDYETEDWESIMQSVISAGYTSEKYGSNSPSYSYSINNKVGSFNFKKLSTKWRGIEVHAPMFGKTRVEIH